MTAEQFAAIPAELKACNNWVCWKAIPDAAAHSGVRKVPVNPRTGGNASTNKPETWASFDEAAAAAITHGFAGIGFVFANSGFFGVDLDDIGDEAGQLDRSEAAAIVDALQTYTERSQSGHGVHCIARGSLPGADMRRGKVEMYAGNRFFVMTGNRLPGTAAAVNDCTESIKPIYSRYQTSGPALPDQMPAAPQTVHTGGADQRSGLTDSEIIEKACSSSPKFARLCAGDFSDFADGSADGCDRSAAEYYFCWTLAFWCGKDAARIDQLYRQQPAMYRAKWDARNGGSTYGARTIAQAIENQPTVYGDRRPADRATSEAAAMPSGDQGGSSMPTAQPIHIESTADLLQNGSFDSFLQDAAQEGELVTGFAQLDDLMCGWHSGLHVIGGSPSAGKTALALQLCDGIAAAGRECLYFSLEVPTGDMIARSISRTSIHRRDALPVGDYEPDWTGLYSALDVIRGRADGQLYTLKAEYLRTVGNRVHIIDTKLTTAEICSTVRAFTQQAGRAPCVFIDYLQLVAQISAAAAQDAKAATDTAVEAFTQLAKDLQTHVFVISSLNRMGYDVPADMSFFKESGGVEYSACTAMILQLALVYDKVPKKNKAGETTGLRAPYPSELDREKQRQPRSIDLAIVKSRYSKGAGGHLRLEYYSRCDYFRETTAATTAAEELAAADDDDQTSGAGGEAWQTV